MVYDVEELSTPAYRLLAAVDLQGLQHPIIETADFRSVQELVGEGLASHLEPCAAGYRVMLTDAGQLAVQEGMQEQLPAMLPRTGVVVKAAFTPPVGANDADVHRQGTATPRVRSGVASGAKS